jgi:hypothetical protein
MNTISARMMRYTIEDLNSSIQFLEQPIPSPATALDVIKSVRKRLLEYAVAEVAVEQENVG